MTPPDSIFDPPTLSEAEQFTKPGTANVSPADLKKLGPLMKHYKGMAHPFTACKRDQIKHGLSEDHANRRCAVLMDLGVKAPGWRSREDVARDLGWAIEDLDELIEDARSELKVLTGSLGAAAIASIATGGVKAEGLSESDATLRHLAEQDICLLEWFNHMPETTAEAYNPPSWMTPAAAKAPGFKPLKPPKKTSSSSSSSTGSDFNSKHPRGSGALGGQFIRKGASGGAVKAIQRKLGVKTTGTVDGQTVRRIRTYQENHGLQVDGVIGSQTAASLLGRPAKSPGALTDGLTRGLRRLSTKLHAEALNERAVHVQHTVRDNGIKAASTSSIRSALFDLGSPESPTHTVKLPNGTKVKAAAGAGYNNFRRKFTATNGKETVTATGTDEAADVAKELDSRTKLTEAEMDDLWGDALSEGSVQVSGYVTRSGKHVGAYSQVRKLIGGMKAGASVHFPDGLKVHHIEGDYRVTGPAKVDSTISSADEAASAVVARSAASTHLKSLGGATSHKGVTTKKQADALPADNPKLPGTPSPEFVADRAAKARKSVKLPSRKQRAENERKAKAGSKGDALDNFDTGKPKTPSTAKTRAGSKRLAADNAAFKKREAERKGKAPGTPKVIASKEDGSAYFLKGNTLMQVPLNRNGGIPDINHDNPSASGAGAVDFTRGFDNEADRARVRKIKQQLGGGGGHADASTKEADRELSSADDIKNRIGSLSDGDVVYLNGVRVEKTPNGWKVKGSLHGKGVTWGRAVRYGSASTAAKKAAELVQTHHGGKKKLTESIDDSILAR